MKKDQAQLIEERKQLLADLENIVSVGKNEKRKLSATEVRATDNLKNQIAGIDAELEQKPGKPEPSKRNQTPQPNKTFSLLKAIRSAANGVAFDEDTAAYIEMGRAEMRKSNLETIGSIVLPMETRASMSATVATSGLEAIQTDVLNMIGPLRDALVLVQAGATFMSGMVGNFTIPKYAGSSVDWVTEGITSTDGMGATSDIDFAPKRLTGFFDIDKKFLIQDSANAEALLMADIVAAISGKLESTILGKVAGDATKPAGLFAVAPSIKGSASWANIVGLETAVDSANAATGNLKYICGGAARGILKKTVKVANQATYLMDANGNMNGYPTLVTNAVASALQVGGDEYGIVFGNWADYVIAQWGGLDLMVDPYTQAHLARVRIHVNAYFDAKPRRDESFKTGSVK